MVPMAGRLHRNLPCSSHAVLGHAGASYTHSNEVNEACCMSLDHPCMPDALECIHNPPPDGQGLW